MQTAEIKLRAYPKALTIVIACLGACMVVTTSLLFVIASISGKPVFRAVIYMATGLVLLWNILAGLLMYRFRDRVRAFVLALPGWWGVKFVVFCILLALTEEAITTTMTNLAPAFGVPIGRAYITASANYLDVVCFHSVIVFAPWFVGWAVMLYFFDFLPTEVFLLFGLTGTIAETNLFMKNPLELFFWIFVYGLMIYLPAYCIPTGRDARRPRWWFYPLAIFIPFLFMILLLPYGIVKPYFHSAVEIHFPPITPNT